MRKNENLQIIFYRAAILMEMLLAGCILLMILILTGVMLADYFADVKSLYYDDAFENFLRKILSFAIGIEFVKMLVQHRPENVIDVLIFAISRQMIVEHTGIIEMLLRIVGIGLLFAIQKFLIAKTKVTDGGGMNHYICESEDEDG